MKNYLWYKTWTEKFIEGLPIGNGRLAAMMLGRPEKLRVALNHEWLWRGENRYRECQTVYEHLPEIRQALIAEDFLKATELCAKHLASPGGDQSSRCRVAPYQPVGDIWVSVDYDGIDDYKRSLDLDTGLASAEFSTAYGKIIQKVFVSCVDDCVVLDVEADFDANINICLSRIDDPVCTVSYEQEIDGVTLKGAFDDGVSFESTVKIITDGTWTIEKNVICVKNAKHTLLLTQVGTNVKGNSPRDEMTFPKEQCFEVLFERHAKYFAELKGDSVVDIDVEDCDLPTDQRIALFREGKEPSLPLLYFEYGRYLMVSGSSGELPLNLQGKWNEDLQPPWDADYHFDVNLQMCYWFVEVLGMRRAANTMFNLIEHHVPYAKEVAKKLYNCNGISFCITSDIWGRSTPEAPGWATWIGATPWLGQHMFMHWRHTKDMQFLKDRCYPFLKLASEFYEDYLVQVGDELWIMPSQSPENRFEGTGDYPVSIGVNSAMDIELATELLSNAAECADILNIDADKAEKWRNIVARLPKLSTDSLGRLNEWDRERVEVEPGHRHLSHLYGLYPAQLFEPGSAEWKAAERSLDIRLSHGGGHTGWSRSWVACLMARLGRSADVWEHFIALIGDFATDSLLDLHPPRIFQIDGNMGGTACVCEMLMQSRRDLLRILPALPEDWKNGKVRNFHAQDGVTVSFAWNDGKLSSFELTSSEDMFLKVVSADKEWNVVLKANEPTCVCCK